MESSCRNIGRLIYAQYCISLKSLPHFISLVGADNSSIKKAESILGIYFSDEYKAYMKAFGAVSADGHDITGISSFPRLYAIDARVNNTDVPKDWCVIEKTNIDSMAIWQKNGEIYHTQPCFENIKIDDSLVKYATKK